MQFYKLRKKNEFERLNQCPDKQLLLLSQDQHVVVLLTSFLVVIRHHYRRFSSFFEVAEVGKFIFSAKAKSHENHETSLTSSNRLGRFVHHDDLHLSTKRV
jgi:hypothetical protein